MDNTLESKIRMWQDDNEHFLGEEIDEDKMRRLKLLQSYCEQIVQLEPTATDESFDFTERNRNGLVIMVFPSVQMLTDKRICELMSKAFAEADAFATSTLGEKLRMTFIVRDMWKKFGYDNDLEHKDEDWHGKLKVVK